MSDAHVSKVEGLGGGSGAFGKWPDRTSFSGTETTVVAAYGDGLSGSAGQSPAHWPVRLPDTWLDWPSFFTAPLP